MTPLLGTVVIALGPPALLALAINVSVGIVGVMLQTEMFFDATALATFISCALLALWTSATSALGTTTLAADLPYTEHPFLAGVFKLHSRHLLLTTAILVWSIRLGSFLLFRAHILNGDRRFDKVKTRPFRFAILWLIQAVWCTIALIPLYATLAIPSEWMMPISRLDVLGMACFVIGFTTEFIADVQKLTWQIRMGDKRFTLVNNQGLWSLCRYPNYFGEILLWTGVAVVSVASLDLSTLNSVCIALLMCTSPLFVAFMLLRVSGIPPQELMAKTRYANSKAYDVYVAHTNMILPWFPSTASHKED
ncbi:hypothetical protein BASA61_007759 [Batrachochytrium salamandrivorans]|nr:hypothetical protein BASA62_008404 [Batrachochytrium salamandrivorans]KAH6567901.1 hypothetical protein BASA62_005863 [Batrachochytrium salamandrivorans]KAH6583997.1 hypothetical protein BASA61_007759 [Batrachochytrium salamandrivorans]KAH9269905.1 hypothetical protein BASA83_008060 [Batrachochytrium salamandrivorans]